MTNIEKFIKLELTNENIDDEKHAIPAILAELFLSHKFVTKNKNLKKYANQVAQIEYKDYLFSSRTTLYARLVKDIYVAAHENDVAFFNEFQAAVHKMWTDVSEDTPTLDEKSSNNTTKSTKKIKKESALTQWQRIIEGME